MNETPFTDDVLRRTTLYHLAELIQDDWPAAMKSDPEWGFTNPAGPYLDAMTTLPSIESHYGADSGRSIVNYFLVNASSWRGPIARQIKNELRRRLAQGDR